MVDYAALINTSMEGKSMSPKISNHKDLQVWNRAMLLAETVYRLTANLPVTERYGLSTQMRRAVVSVPSNVAEGAARGSSAEFLRYVMIALGSLAELETQLLLVDRLGLCEMSPEVLDNLQVVRKMLIALHRSLHKRKSIS